MAHLVPGPGRNTYLERGLPAEPQTEAEACRVLEAVQSVKGYLSTQTLAYLETAPPDAAKEIHRGFEALRVEAAAFTKSIATELNSSDFHFIYELLQNADDANYNIARQDGSQPWMKFSVSPTELVVDTNEDGFMRANVEAICATGRSSKKTSVQDKHIGEKGFGFKSVFVVAEKVQIRSRVWSFHFDHGDEDTGLGMVTPIIDDAFALPVGVRTRITLSLNAKHRKKYARLAGAFENLADTTIFFLQQLSKLTVTVQKVDGSTSSVTYAKETDATTVRLRTQIGVGDATGGKVEERFFQIFKGVARDMPSDRRRPGQKSAPIVLAFPTKDMTGQTAAIDESGQYFFAYLPVVRMVQLKFMIHSDFITSASRESTIDCEWNDHLLDAIADTFGDAIQSFCQRGILVHEWLRFVPQQPIEGYWKSLKKRILQGLRWRPILQTWQPRLFRTPDQLIRLPGLFLHNGQPLFADISPEAYLAPEYRHDMSKLLNKLGINEFSWDKGLDRIEHDINSPNSRLKSTPLSDTWHNAVAKALQTILEEAELQKYRQRVRALKIIPVVGGAWLANDSLFCNRYFPMHEDVRVPTDIGFDIVMLDATTSPERNRLLRNLGVRECPPEEVVKYIWRHHKFGWPKNKDDAITHFRYLYWVWPKRAVQSYSTLWAYTDTGIVTQPIDGLYFKTDMEYSTAQLLKTTGNDTMATPTCSNVSFLHDDYLKPEHTTRFASTLTWKMWLEQIVGIRYYPLLMDVNSPKDLSPILKHILSISSPKFLHTLRARWMLEYQHIFESSNDAKTALKTSEVLCTDGRRRDLQLTYLPTAEIVMQQELLALSKKLPILDLGNDEVLPTGTSDWEFLKRCDVRGELDVNFHLIALRASKEDKMAKTSSTTRMIYQWIGSNAKQNQSKNIREHFNFYSLVYIPSLPVGQRWKAVSDCVWDAPNFLTVKTGLADQYGGDSELSALFQNILGVRDANFHDFLDELRARKSPPGMDLARTTTNIYDKLWKSISLDADWALVRSQFEKDHLVYADGRWHPPTSCLWSSPVKIGGKVILQGLYHNLQEFFVTKLKIKKAEVGMLVQDLTKKLKAKTPPPPVEVKSLLLKIAEMLRTEREDSGAKDHFNALKQLSFLPVKLGAGDTYLAGIHSDFAILDHRQYAEAFSSSIRTLDFSQIEVLKLDPLLTRLGLKARGLSHLVKEKSTAGASSSRDDGLTKDFRNRAYAFYCCALKYNSPQTISQGTTLFDQLSSVEIDTSNDMSTTLALRQDGQDITANSRRAQILVEGVDSTYRICVPRPASEQRSCYRSKLPEQMLRILGISDHSALHSVSRVLSEPLADLDDVMLDLNIPPASWLVTPPITSVSLVPPENDSSDSESTSTAVSGADSTRSGTTGSVFSRPIEIGTPRTPNWPPLRGALFTPSTSQSGGTPPIDNAVSETSSRQGGPSRFPFTFSPAPPSGTPRQTSSAANATRLPASSSQGPVNYCRLLSQLIELASKAANNLPAIRPGSGSIFDLNGLMAALPREDPFLSPIFDLDSIFGPRGMARDFKIGAAGELYVFERLKKLALPDFTWDNWQSRIRKEVSIHPAYASMPPYLPSETADIVYADTNGELTRFLRSNCHGRFPDFPPVVDLGNHTTTPPITYYLEVKTTTSPNPDEKFYMSKGEYELMQSYALQPGQTPTEIYVILRVYNLTSNQIGIKFFVDPCRYEANGTLRFETGVYHVYPTTSTE